jgi:hypothetical protein
MLIATVAILLIAAPNSSFAGDSGGWVLYDNFNSGPIDLNKWDIDNSSAEISVEGGRAKFVHDANIKGDSSWLIFKKSPEKIKAIKVKVKMENDTDGDTRARIGGYLGQNGVGNAVWLQMGLRNQETTTLPSQQQRVEASAVVLQDTSATAAWLYDLFYSHVGKPDGLVGNWYVLEMYFNRYSLLFKGNGVGLISHVLTEPVLPLNNSFKGIGTRNNTAADTTFTVYFDDVYVLY